MRTIEDLNERLSQAEHIGLFLDYDGTLADFAPTPDIVKPDQEVIALLGRLRLSPRMRIAIISGRALQQIQTLIPVSGILLAGTYGIEIQNEYGEIVHRLDLATIRPTLEDIKPSWQALISERRGYFLEDKIWSLALHARFAPDGEAERVLEEARSAAGALPPALFRLFEGHKFFEVGPALAHKGQSVEYILGQEHWGDVMPLYLGDDARDEEAFETIEAHGGASVVVAQTPRSSQAEYSLATPKDVRRWLKTLADQHTVLPS